MSNYAADNAGIVLTLSNYFKGIFYGDVALLRSAFLPGALVMGDINGEPYAKTLGQYLEGVKTRKSPQQLNETFRMEVISVEIINSIAVAKAHVPMFDKNYYDLLSLNKINGEWLIVNKLLTNVNA
nr:nuclear transport factor 2 family protein [uncultured Mucilaginibacter sp.]